MGLFSRPQVVRRRRDGSFELVLDDKFRGLLRHLLGELDDLIEGSSDDPSLRRLQPPAYLDDPEKEAAYRLLAGDELRTSRRAAIATVLETLDRDGDRLTEDELWLWMQAINAIRLVVGTRLDVSEDDDRLLEVDPDDPDARLWALYELTNLLQYELIEALSG